MTVEGVVDHADGTVDVPEAEQQPAAAHPGTTRNWLPGIEALRGVAALTVVVHHSWSLSNAARCRRTTGSRSTGWSRGSACGA